MHLTYKTMKSKYYCVVAYLTKTARCIEILYPLLHGLKQAKCYQYKSKIIIESILQLTYKNYQIKI